jgi:hypothetical protein
MLAGLVLAGCNTVTDTAKLLGDLYNVRMAVVRATGHQAVQARIRNDTTLLVKLINPPFIAMPADAKQAKAREIARVAIAAYPSRASLDTVAVEFAATTRWFVILVFDATETFTFKAAELGSQS